MAKKKKLNFYSTDPDFEYYDEDDEYIETLPPDQQQLKIRIDKKHRKGKEVTLVDGFIGHPDDLKQLEKILKSYCGVGGSSKHGQIIIQGNQMQKIRQKLKDHGYRVS